MAIIWTKHAIERNKERQITVSLVEKTINSPDKSFPQEEGKIKYVKDFGKQTVSAVTTKTDHGEYLILSAWIDPPNPGTANYKKEGFRMKMKNAGTLKKFWLTLRNQINI
jgi:hypothetical protein